MRHDSVAKIVIITIAGSNLAVEQELSSSSLKISSNIQSAHMMPRRNSEPYKDGNTQRICVRAGVLIGF
jgi:hypothetical protein